jgi:hypothetical protein
VKYRRRPPLLEPLESRLLLANTIVDLLALYTPQAQQAVNGTTAILRKIEDAVAATNTVMVNSKIPLTVRLVGMTLENYQEAGDLGTDLGRLSTPEDGFLDDVPTLRNFFGADLVTLITSHGSPAGAGLETIGIGEEMTTPKATGNADLAYSVVSQANAGTANYTLAHELGHNLGAAHASDDSTDSGARTYSHGYRFTGNDGQLYHDVMAYDPGTEIPYYSNPRITYKGVPEGNAATADASRVITEDAPEVAAYRSIHAIGGLDAPVGGALTGWAYDPRALHTPITVVIQVDGKFVKPLTASATRNALLTTLGTTNHGFSYTVGVGAHVVSVYEIDTAGQALLLGTRTVTNARPRGTVDAASATTIAGWAIDDDSPATPTRINILIDGTTVLSQLADKPRNDLKAFLGSANHAYAFTLPALSIGFHRVDVYAVDNTAGVVLLGSRTINTNQLAFGYVDTVNATTISGWAMDPNDFNRAIQVRYDIDGVAPQFTTAGLDRPDLHPPFPATNHGFSITLPQLAAGVHTVHVYAVDPDNLALTPLASRNLVVTPPPGQHLPIGSLDIATSNRIAGWAYDQDIGPSPLQVRIDVDGITGTPTPAAAPRPDLVARFGASHLGFDIRNIGLSAGPHRIDLYALDNAADTPVLIASRIINNALNFGFVESLTAARISGWAYAQAAPGHQATLRIDIDGLPGATLLADDPKPAVAATLGGPNFGFSVPLPKVAPGLHVVRVWLLDPVTDSLLLLRTGKILSPT